MRKIYSAVALASLIAALIFSSIGLNASVKDLPIKTINGTPYHYYEVQPKETVYSLTHKLDITYDDLVAANPAVADGLKAYQVLYFPAQTENQAVTTAVAGFKAHTVVKGETIYGICQKYGITPEQLTELNPSIKDGLKAGKTLIISKGESAKSTTPVVKEEKTPEGKTHLVLEGETFFSIARANGLTVAELEAANPSVTVLKQGEVINIPEPVAEQPKETITIENTPVSPTVEPIKITQDSVADTPTEPVVVKGETRVAVMLPFKLKQATMDKATARHLEFYKGFLLAVDSLRNSGNTLKVYAYDTSASTDSVAKLLKRPELKKMQVIVAPDDEKQLALLGQFGLENNVAILNPFVVKDTTYVTNRAIIQTNIPTEQMYAKAINAFLDRLNGETPVFLKHQNGKTDKAEFVQLLQKEMANRNIEYKTLNYSDKLTEANLASLAAGNYVFIPESGLPVEANSFLAALNAYRDKVLSQGFDIKLWGYPEWTTFKGDNLDGIRGLNAVIYSRFSEDKGSMEASALSVKYQQWYNGKLSDEVPNRGLLGFDIGMFLIKSLNGADKSLLDDSLQTYRGVQNSFQLGRDEGCEGLCNHALYIINYRPSGLVENYLLP